MRDIPIYRTFGSDGQLLGAVSLTQQLGQVGQPVPHQPRLLIPRPGSTRKQRIDLREECDIYDLARQGKAVPITDCLIAALAIEHAAIILTCNTSDYPKDDVNDPVAVAVTLGLACLHADSDGRGRPSAPRSCDATCDSRRHPGGRARW